MDNEEDEEELRYHKYQLRMSKLDEIIYEQFILSSTAHISYEASSSMTPAERKSFFGLTIKSITSSMNG